MAKTQSERPVSVDTPLGEDVLLLAQFAGEEYVSRPFEYRLIVLSEDYDISFDDIVGRNVAVRMNMAGNNTRYFNGFVSRFVQTGQIGGMSRYSATLVPWLWFLSRTSDCRIFQEKSVPEIIKEVFEDNGFTDFKDELNGEYPARNYCVQYRETDFNFVSRLMEDTGIYYYFEHEDDRHVMILADSLASHVPFPGYESLSYLARSRGSTEVEHIRDWRVRKEVKTGNYVHEDYDFTNPRKRLEASAQMERAHAMSDFEVYDYPGHYNELRDGEEWAQVRLEELQARHEVVEGEADARGIAPGFTFQLQDHPREDQCREYLVLSTTHEYVSDEFEGGEQPPGEGPLYSCSFRAMDAREQYRPPRIAPKPLVEGPQTAIVVGKEGEEIWTDEYGRVKVQFHWDRYGESDENSSCWVRVSQVWAGTKWGAQHIPRIGQEVVVDFLEGDPDRPIIIGRVYNRECMPPYKLPENDNLSTIKSNSTKDAEGFNEIRFDDKEGGEQIFVHGERNIDIRAKNDYYETNQGSRFVRVGNDGGEHNSGDYNTHVSRDVNYHVGRNGYCHIEGQYNETVSKDVVQHHKQDHKIYISGTIATNATESITETTDLISAKSDVILVEGSREIQARGRTVNIEAGSTLNLRANRINLEGSAAVSLKVGGNFVVIDQSGVSIRGTLVRLNSGGSANSAEKAKGAKEMPEGEVILPVEAASADDGRPGEAGDVRGRQQDRETAAVERQKASNYNPPPPEPETEAPVVDGGEEEEEKPVPLPVSDEPCGIAALNVECEHGRKPGPSNELQVVPSRGGSEDQVTLEWGFGEVTLGARISKVSGGEEEVLANVETNSGSKDGEILRTEQSGPPPSDGWEQGGKNNYVLSSPQQTPISPSKCTPHHYYIHGRGCDDVHQTVTVEAFPADQSTYELRLEGLKEVVKQANKALEMIFKKSWGPVDFNVKIKEPSGHLTVSTGWDEHTDWRAFYGIQADAGLDPVFGLDFSFQVSLAKVASNVGLGSIGIPPPVSSWIGDHLGDYIADILAAVGVGPQLSIKGGMERKIFTSGEKEDDGKCTVELQGEVYAHITGRLGNEVIAGVEMRGKASSGLNQVGDITLKEEAVYAGIKIVCPGLEFELSFAVKACKMTIKSINKKWQPIDEFDVWPRDGAAERKLMSLE